MTVMNAVPAEAAYYWTLSDTFVAVKGNLYETAPGNYRMNEAYYGTVDDYEYFSSGFPSDWIDDGGWTYSSGKMVLLGDQGVPIDSFSKRVDTNRGIEAIGAKAGYIYSDVKVTYDVQSVYASVYLMGYFSSGAFFKIYFIDSSGNLDLMGTYTSGGVKTVSSTSSQYKHGGFRIVYYGYTPANGWLSIDNHNGRVVYGGYHHESIATFSGVSTSLSVTAYDVTFGASWSYEDYEDVRVLAYNWNTKKWDYLFTTHGYTLWTYLMRSHVSSTGVVKIMFYSYDVYGDTINNQPCWVVSWPSIGWEI